MKRLLAMALTTGLILSMTVVTAAAPKVTVGGEGNYGYDFAKESYKGKDGANFGDLALTASAEVSNTVSLFGKLKTEDISKGEGKYFTDEAWAYLKFAPLNLKVGYYSFNFYGNKDILDMPVNEFKSTVGLQLETLIVETVAAKLYFPTRSNADDVADVADEKVCADNAFGLRFDYNKEAFGFGVIYGKTDGHEPEDGGLADDITVYTLTGYYKPMKDIKTFLDYSTQKIDPQVNEKKSIEDTSIIIGVLYAPEKLPYECRLEYDLDDESKQKEWKDFNPWGIRLAYKLNPNTKVEINCNGKEFGAKERSVKLNLTF